MIALVALIVLVAGAVGVFYFQEQKKEEEHEALLQSIAQGADDIIEHISSVLNASAPTTWVYDRDNNLMFTVRLTEALQSVKVVPQTVSNVITSKADGDVAVQVVREYLTSKGVGLSGDTETGYLRRVMSEISTEDLVRYLAISSTFGGSYVGITDTAYNYFGKTVEQLTQAQLEFLATTYRNDSVNVDEYLEQRSLNREKLGLMDLGLESAAIRTLVMEELARIPSVDAKSKSYNVKLTISTSQQASLQAALDSGMRSMIDLNADGTYALDASVVAIDGNTGFIRALVPARSSTKKASTAFSLNGLGFADNFSTFIATLCKEGVTGQSLVKVTKENGDIIYRSIGELFQSLALDNSAVNKTVSALDVVNLLFANEEAYQGVSMIAEVKEVKGQTVYLAKGTTGLQLLNSKVCEFFSEGQDYTVFGSDFELDTGIISFQKTSDYIVVFVGGAGAVGGTATSVEVETLKAASTTLKELVASLYPTPSVKIWSPTDAETVIGVYETNYKLVGEPIFEGIATLMDLPITSRDERQTWEEIYNNFQSSIVDNSKYIGESRTEQLNVRLSSARTARTQELLQYSV